MAQLGNHQIVLGDLAVTGKIDPVILPLRFLRWLCVFVFLLGLRGPKASAHFPEPGRLPELAPAATGEQQPPPSTPFRKRRKLTIFDWKTVYDGLGRRVQTTNQPTILNAQNQEVSNGTPLKLTYYYDPQVEFLELGLAQQSGSSSNVRRWKIYGPDVNGLYGGAQGIGGLEAIVTESTGTATVTAVASNYFGDVVGDNSSGSWLPFSLAAGNSGAVEFNNANQLNGSPSALGSYGALPGSGVNFLQTQWRGHYLDQTGFYCLGARYYEPHSGRFLSADPAGLDSDLSLYAYCNGDPVNGIDPDGRFGKGAISNQLNSDFSALASSGTPYNPIGDLKSFLGIQDDPDAAANAMAAYTQRESERAAEQDAFAGTALTLGINAAVAIPASIYGHGYGAITGEDAFTGERLTGLQQTGQAALFALDIAPFVGEGIGIARAAIGTLETSEGFSVAAETEGLRMMQMPNYSSNLGPGVLGSTDVSGNITIARGLSWEEQAATLRHESVHAFLSVSDNAPLAATRQNFGMWAYNNSQLARFSEEAIAETYGSGSLLKGLAHPFVNGYGITPGGLLMETGIYAGAVGGAGYLGYRIGGGQ